MAGRDIVLIGASAGGVEAISELVDLLPADFPGTIYVVLHVPAHSPSLLPQIYAVLPLVEIAPALVQLVGVGDP